MKSQILIGILSGFISGLVVSLSFEIAKYIIKKINNKKFIDYIFSCDLSSLNHLFIYSDLLQNIIDNLNNKIDNINICNELQNDKRMLIEHLSIKEINMLDVLMIRTKHLLKSYYDVLPEYKIKDNEILKYLYSYYFEADKPHNEPYSLDKYSLWKYPADKYIKKFKIRNSNAKKYIYLLNRYLTDSILLYETIVNANNLFSYLKIDIMKYDFKKYDF